MKKYPYVFNKTTHILVEKEILLALNSQLLLNLFVSIQPPRHGDIPKEF